MSAQNEHGSIITKAAREILLPLGIRQKGRSRKAFNGAVACGLVGRVSEARRLFTQIKLK
jgi:hypothetical protein